MASVKDITSGLSKLLRLSVVAPIYLLSFLVPRTDAIWVFGCWGGTRFLDNSKYLYLHAVNSADERDVLPVWITREEEIARTLREKGYEAHRIHSLKGAYYVLRSNKHVLTNGLRDVGAALTGRADRIRLWHAFPLKKVACDEPYYEDSNFVWKSVLRHIYDSTCVMTTASSLAPIFSSAFRVPEDRVTNCGYPRNDVLLSEIPGEHLLNDPELISELSEITDEYRTFMYMPTWRRYKPEDSIEQLDLERLDHFLEETGSHFFAKTHPYADEIDDTKYDNITKIPSSTDVYPILRDVDYLITDYSSIYIDYILTGNPVIFYPYDLDEFRENRGLYFDYDAVTPGPKPQRFDELLFEMKASIRDDPYVDERERVRREFHDNVDSKSSKRVYDQIRSLCE